MVEAKDSRKRARRGGFTLVELLIVVMITAVGFVALLDLQVSSIRGLNYPAQMNAAINLGEHLIETLQLEAYVQREGGPTGTLRYLPVLPPFGGGVTDTGWQQAFSNGSSEHAMTDQVGADTTYDVGALTEFPALDRPRFCVRYRLAWVSENLARAEVRVLWLRDEASWTRFRNCPDEGPDAMEDLNNRDSVQFVTLTEQLIL